MVSIQVYGDEPTDTGSSQGRKWINRSIHRLQYPTHLIQVKTDNFSFHRIYNRRFWEKQRIKSKSFIFFGKYIGENRNRKSPKMTEISLEIFKTTEVSP